jgi:ABC-type spermidine/putrescine transport system permease subunit II
MKIGFLLSSLANTVLSSLSERVNYSTLPYLVFTLLAIQWNDVVEMAHIVLFCTIVIPLLGVPVILD